MGKRDNSIDLLRIVASFFVVAIHVSGTYDIMMTNGLLAPSYSLSVMMNLTDCGVSIFFVISGAFLLSNDRYASFKTFYKHSAKTIAIPTLIFSIYYILYSIIPSALRGDIPGIRYEITETVYGRPFFHMWYLYTLLCIHLFIPAIIRLRQMVSDTVFERISILIFISSSVSDMTSSHTFQYDPGSAYRYIGYLFAGYVAYRHSTKNKARGALLAGFALIFLFVGSIARYNSYSGTELPFAVEIVLRFMLILCPVMIFAFMAHFKIEKDITRFSGLCFYIYLIHAGVLDLMLKFTTIVKGEEWIWSLMPAGVTIVALSAMIFIISAVLAVVYDRLQKICERRFHIRQRLYECIRAVILFIFSGGCASP